VVLRADKPRSIEPDHQFFHRKHIVTTFWALVASLLTLIATCEWQSSQGPQKVYVMNLDTTVRVALGRDTALAKRIDQLSAELHVLRGAGADRPIFVVGADEFPGTNPLQSPTFRVPAGVQGYLAASLRTLATATCPRGPFRPSSEIPIRARLKSRGTIAQLTPLIVSLARRQSQQTMTIEWEAQFEPRADNFVLAPAPRDTGTYELTAGFYLKSELNTKYPPFYRLECQVRVAP
jgi:hypothetical protein